MIQEVLGLFRSQRMPKLGNLLLGKPRVCAWTFAEESLCMTSTEQSQQKPEIDMGYPKRSMEGSLT